MSDILLVCTKFAEREENGWLTNDLAKALAGRGERVRVLNVDWAGANTPGLKTIYGDVEVLNLRMYKLPTYFPRLLQLLWKWIFSRFLVSLFIPGAWKFRRYDLAVGFSPAVATRGVMRFFTKRANRSFLIYWDFFPTHQQQLGLVPGGIVGRAAYLSERNSVATYDAVGCMSQANIKFFQSYFPRYAGAVVHLPVWGPDTLIDISQRDALRMQYGFAADDVVSVFGGQLIPGRGIEAICDLADVAADLYPRAVFVIAGSGEMEALVRARASAGRNLRFVGQLSRDAYAGLLSASDIGLVFTPEICVPTFPSKTVDYLRAGLPILASVESMTDYRDILQNEIGAGLGSVAGDRATLVSNLGVLVASSQLREACGQRGRSYYSAHMAASRVAEKLQEYSKS